MRRLTCRISLNLQFLAFLFGIYLMLLHCSTKIPSCYTNEIEEKFQIFKDIKEIVQITKLEKMFININEFDSLEGNINLPIDD